MPSNVKARGGKRSQPKHKKRTKSSSEHSPDGSEGDLELDRELYPIGHYLYDRAEMVEQMFDILRKDKIQSMLPPVLKEIKLDDLKAQCLEQLNSMSEKHILKILEGKPYAPDLEDDNLDKNLKVVSSSSSSSSSGESDPSSASSSDSEPEKEGKANKIQAIIKPDPDKVDDDPDMLHIGLSPKELGDFLSEEEDSEKREKESSTNTKKNIKEGNIQEKPNENNEGKTLLEILELEMRARAIRALLKQASSASKNKPKSECSSSKRESSESKNDSPFPTEASATIVKAEVVSEEEDVVFVSESQDANALSKKSETKKLEKECLSAVYNVSADILKFKPTVLSATSKVSVVDTAGNPITLPKVKSQSKGNKDDLSVVIIDNELCEPASGSKADQPKLLEKKEATARKRKVKSDISFLSSDAERDLSNNASECVPIKETSHAAKATQDEQLDSKNSKEAAPSREEICMKNGKKVIVELDSANT